MSTPPPGVSPQTGSSVRSAHRPSTRIAAGDQDALHQDRSTWLRLLLLTGVAVTAVSAAALVLLLVSYALNVTAWPVFYWFGLYGLPLGFALMLGYVVLAAVLRRRS